MNERNIEIININEESKTVRVNSILLHSQYNPALEAEMLLDCNPQIYENKNEIFVYGTGFGYHINELLRRCKNEVIIHVFDIDEEIFNISLEQGMLRGIENNPRVKLYIGHNESVFEELSDALSTAEDFWVYNPSVKVLPKKYQGFQQALINYQLGRIAIFKYADKMQENYEANLKASYQPIERFFEKTKFKDQPVIIVASGPSLDDSIPFLKKSNNNVKIFCVGSALKALVNHGILPDMFCIIDPVEVVYEQIRGMEDLKIPMCFLSTASNTTVEKYQGPKYMFYNDPKYDKMVIETGKSVATAVLDMAVKGQPSTIIFVGQDLAYINNKSHYTDFPNQSFELSIEKYKRVQGVNNTEVETTAGLLSFKSWIERHIQRHSRIRYINCSKGARIEGTEEMDIEEVLKTAAL